MSEVVRFSSVDVGQTVHVRLENIRDRNGNVVDPATVTGKIQDPSDNETTYIYGTDAQLVKESTGTYYFEYTVDEAGTWYVRIESTSPAAGYETSFTVNASQF